MATSEKLKIKKKYPTTKSKNAMAIKKVLPTTTKTQTIRAWPHHFSNPKKIANNKILKIRTKITKIILKTTIISTQIIMIMTLMRVTIKGVINKRWWKTIKKMMSSPLLQRLLLLTTRQLHLVMRMKISKNNVNTINHLQTSK